MYYNVPDNQIGFTANDYRQNGHRMACRAGLVGIACYVTIPPAIRSRLSVRSSSDFTNARFTPETESGACVEEPRFACCDAASGAGASGRLSEWSVEAIPPFLRATRPLTAIAQKPLRQSEVAA